MERDFMGLAMTVKEETPDEIYDAEPVRSTAMQWSFQNKASGVAQLLSFQGAMEDKPKTGFESLASTGLVTITTSDANQKSYPNIAQQSSVHERNLGVCYSAATYPLKRHDHSHTIHRQVTGQTNLISSPATSAASFGANSGQNLIGSVRTLHPHLSGASITNPVPAACSSSPLVGSTELKTSTKISEGPAQLTIFYRGSVCVYDNIPTEKAQAIMLLAGNGPPMTSSTPIPTAAIPASMPMSSVLDGFVVSKPYGTTPRRSSPVPLISVSVPHTTIRSVANSNDTTALKPTGNFVSSCHKSDTVKAVTPIRSVPATTFLSTDSVPQFRRKSLARFLEKRKERVISTSPYEEKKSPECGMNGASSASLSMNSLGSCPTQPLNV